MTLYALKPRFQRLLRPSVIRLADTGVTANHVTVAAAVGSIAVGGAVALLADAHRAFLLIPAWLFARMALNAIDGMLARECHQQTVLGGYLNEIGDVVSDAALYAPFAVVAPFSPAAVALVIVLAIVAEFAGAIGPAFGASRRYDGPMGKSDRAVVFGALGLSVAMEAAPAWLGLAMAVVAALLVVTSINRVRAGVHEAAAAQEIA